MPFIQLNVYFRNYLCILIIFSSMAKYAKLAYYARCDERKVKMPPGNFRYVQSAQCSTK